MNNRRKRYHISFKNEVGLIPAMRRGLRSWFANKQRYTLVAHGEYFTMCCPESVAAKAGPYCMAFVEGWQARESRGFK